MSEARVSKRSDLDAIGVGDRSSIAPNGLSMEMTPAVTPTAAVTRGATIFDLIERNEHG